MAEDEVLYASVVVKSRRPPTAKKEEEVVYDEVKLPNQPVQQTLDTNVSKLPELRPRKPDFYSAYGCAYERTPGTRSWGITFHKAQMKRKENISQFFLKRQKPGPDQDQTEPCSSDQPGEASQETPGPSVSPADSAGLLSNKEAERKYRWYQKMACCFGILCVILVLAIIAVFAHFLFPHKRDEQELKQLKANQTLLLEEIYNLTDLNNKLSSDFNIQVHNLTQEKENLRLQNQNLKTELDKVKNKNQQLQEEQKNLTEQIETMEKTWNEQNVSRAQWSVDEYCPKEKNKRNCSSCQKGWTHSQSSCYAVNNAEPQNQKTWKEAGEDCRGKSSDLTVVGDEEEKKFVKDNSWTGNKIKGYWIGLRAEGGKWRWIDGSDLTNQTWIQQQPAVDGQCVTSLQGRDWRSVSCEEKNAWICEKKALSV